MIDWFFDRFWVRCHHPKLYMICSVVLLPMTLIERESGSAQQTKLKSNRVGEVELVCADIMIHSFGAYIWRHHVTHCSSLYLRTLCFILFPLDSGHFVSLYSDCVSCQFLQAASAG